MIDWRIFPILIAALAVAAAAAADSFVETFDGGSNEGGWSFGTGNEVIETSGGNPGAYLHDPSIDSYAPQPRTAWGTSSVFVGDFRTNRVTGLSIDLITLAVDFSAEGRPLALMLVSDNGTPASSDDDWAGYTLSPDNVPLPDQGWLGYSFVVPSWEPTWPADWHVILFGPDSPPAPDWNTLITAVDQVRFHYGDPEMVFIFQMWNLGLDNPGIHSDLVFADGFETGDTGAWSSVVP